MSGLRTRVLTVSSSGFSVDVEFDGEGLEETLELLVVAPGSDVVASVLCVRPPAPATGATLACNGTSVAEGCTCA